MAEIRWYMDEHVPLPVTQGLRRRGIDVLTTQDAGMAGAQDDQQLAHATSQGRAIVTQDDDFLRLHAAGIAHTGIAYAPQGTPVGALVRALTELSLLLDSTDLVERVEFL